jgi:hypothetical protein
VKRKLSVEKKAFLAEQVSAILQNNNALKYKDPGCPTISCFTGEHKIKKALFNLGASVYFVVMNTQHVEACNSIPIILGCSFLETFNALINYKNGPMKLSFGNMTLKMNVFNICKQLGDDNDLQEVDFIEELVNDQFETTLSKTDFNESEDLQMLYSHKEIKDKKDTENVVADHLSRLTIDSISDITPINDYFPDESLLSVATMPWFADFVNFLAKRDYVHM